MTIGMKQKVRQTLETREKEIIRTVLSGEKSVNQWAKDLGFARETVTRFLKRRGLKTVEGDDLFSRHWVAVQGVDTNPESLPSNEIEVNNPFEHLEEEDRSRAEEILHITEKTLDLALARRDTDQAEIERLKRLVDEYEPKITRLLDENKELARDAQLWRDEVARSRRQKDIASLQRIADKTDALRLKLGG